MAFWHRKKRPAAGAEPDLTRLPRHIGIIMDGNGRWAKKRGLPRTAGHAAGAETFRTIAYRCRDLGIPYLTVYAFSTENWKRPVEEVSAIMDLLRKYLLEALEKMEKDGFRIRFFGDLEALPPELRTLCLETEETGAAVAGAKYQINVCLNYGGRDEILRAARAHGMDPQAPAVSGAHISFLVDSGEYEHEEEEFAARAAVLGAVQPPEVHTGFACIVLVGYGVPHNHRTLSRIFQTLQSRNIPVAMIHQGISEISTWVGVGEEHMEEAIRALYLEFSKGK